MLILKLLRASDNLRAHFGTTILVTTHVTEEVDTLCDRFGNLHRGRPVMTGTPAELKASIGPEAALDHLFAKIAGEDAEAEGDYHDIRQTRRSAANGHPVSRL